MPKKIRNACVIGLLLPICACQSYSPPPIPLAVQCEPPPPPAAWFMEPIEPNLTQRMLNELSTLPAMAIED
jgi:hypothetical protein